MSSAGRCWNLTYFKFSFLTGAVSQLPALQCAALLPPLWEQLRVETHTLEMFPFSIQAWSVDQWREKKNNLDIITSPPNAGAAVIRGGGHLLYRCSAPIVVSRALLDGCSKNKTNGGTCGQCMSCVCQVETVLVEWNWLLSHFWAPA